MNFVYDLCDRFIQWRWRRKIAYLQHAIDYYTVHDEDIQRDGKSADWHAGKRVGLKIALYHLFNIKPDNWN